MELLNDIALVIGYIWLALAAAVVFGFLSLCIIAIPALLHSAWEDRQWRREVRRMKKAGETVPDEEG